ncbi:MAG: hypothetical protein LBC67_06975 [Spirochaetales bacterium]|jgi:hypothetical protein|nr:hypothetical protein [Spirochaetales bacterium]
MRRPYCIYKEKTQAGPVWYVKFWNAAAGKYRDSRSLRILAEGKRERRKEAEDKAVEIFAEWSKSHAAGGDILFLDYIKGFWAPDSPYVQERALVNKKPHSAFYLRFNADNIRLHIEPFDGFAGVTRAGLTSGHLRDWKLWAAKKGFSGRLINVCLQAMRVPIRYAFDREEIERDPFK